MLLLLPWLALALPPEVTVAMTTGDCATVHELLPSPSADEERLVVGYCANMQGESKRATDLLEAVTQGVYGDYARLARAESLITLGQAEDALKVLADLELPGAAGRRVALLRGRALILQGRSLEARPALRALLDTDLRDEALYWLAAGAEDRGDTQPAIEAYRGLWASSVRGDGAERAAARLHALGAPVPDLKSSDGRALVARRVQALEDARRYGDALGYRKQIVQAEPDHPLGRPVAMARASALGRDYPGALRIYRELYGAADEATGPPARLFDYALHTSRTGDYDTAAVLYTRLIALHPNTPEAVTASFKLGYLKVDRAEWAEAIPLLRAHLSRHPDAIDADETRWWIGWALHQLGKIPAAHEAWAGLIQHHPNSSLVPAARYWKARSEEDPKTQREGLRRVLKLHPFTGYAAYAAHHLDHRFAPQPSPVRPSWPQPLAEHPAIERFEALLSLGLLAEAREELRPAVEVGKGPRDADLALAWALIEAGAVREGQALARRYCGTPGGTQDRTAAGACWPRPAWPVVSAHSTKHDLPPLLAYGVMVTESALDPNAVSLADARGLMQLMPAEAERLHQDLYGDRPWHPDLLFKPSYNVTLGVTELGQKHAALHGAVEGLSLVPAIAAYNGGETAVRRWIEEQGGQPAFDVFAEQISFTETRRYVRSVLGTMMLYRHVYGDEPGQANDR
ncbi:MAG: hypothetical protein EA397_05970 [Deltaproteobacteria bacterium]|nr:MAG: hypothetical protein EA397_05970 [Deltaproteobacteria bacterium]